MCIGIVPSSGVLCQTERSFIPYSATATNPHVPVNGLGSMLLFSLHIHRSAYSLRDQSGGQEETLRLAGPTHLQYSVPLFKVTHVALFTQGALSFMHCRATRDKKIWLESEESVRHFFSLTALTLRLCYYQYASCLPITPGFSIIVATAGIMLHNGLFSCQHFISCFVCQ